MRGVAVLATVAFHTGVLRGGFLGVDVFFVLSGFLITAILVEDLRRSDSLRSVLAAFYVRRAKRLLPAVLLLLLVVQWWLRHGAPPEQQAVVGAQTRAALVYVSNWAALRLDTGYWDADADRTPLTHLWSLAVEEQFYAAWPLLLLALLLLARRRLLAVAAAAAAAAVASWVWVTAVYATAGSDRAYYGTDTRCGAMLVGASLALVVVSDGGRRTLTSARAASALRVLTPVALAALAVAVSASATDSPWLYRVGLPGVSLAVAVVIASCVARPGAGVTRALAAAPLVWLGERSYALYLWHAALIVMLTEETTGRTGAALWALRAVVTLMATVLSYSLVENPIRLSSVPVRRLVVGLAVPTGVAAAMTVVALPAAPPQLGQRLIAAHASVESGPGLRLLAVGDSWGRNLGLGLARVKGPGDAVFNDGIGGCGLLDAPAYRADGRVKRPEPVCATWQERWRTDMATLQPDAVLLSTGNWDAQIDVELDGRFRGPSDPLWRARYAAQLDIGLAILRQADTPVYVLDVTDPVGGDGSRVGVVNAELAAAVARTPGTTLLSVRSQVCRAGGGCPERIGGRRVYDATGHLTPAVQDDLARWALNQLRAAVVPRSAREASLLPGAPEVASAVLPDTAVVSTGGRPTAEVVREAAGAPAVTVARSALSTLSTGAVVDGGGAVDLVYMRFPGDVPAGAIGSAVVTAHPLSRWRRTETGSYNLNVYARDGAVVGSLRTPGTVTLLVVRGPQASPDRVCAVLVEMAQQVHVANGTVPEPFRC